MPFGFHRPHQANFQRAKQMGRHIWCWLSWPFGSLENRSTWSHFLLVTVDLLNYNKTVCKLQKEPVITLTLSATSRFVSGRGSMFVFPGKSKIKHNQFSENATCIAEIAAMPCMRTQPSGLRVRTCLLNYWYIGPYCTTLSPCLVLF